MTIDNGPWTIDTHPMALPQVLILVETSKAYGRGMLAGIGRYALAHGPWSIFFEERSLFDRLPHWFAQWRGRRRRCRRRRGAARTR